MLPAPAALLASLALAGVTRYTASVSAVARYYTDQEVLQPIGTTVLELEPRLGLDHEGRTSVFRLAYYPRLLMAADSPPPQSLHQASSSLALQLEPGMRLSGAASGCYGTNDFRNQYGLTCGAASLAPAPGAGPQPIPQTTTARYMSLSGALGLEWRTSASLALAGTLSYLVQGGADAPTRALLPLQRGPSFFLALDWTAGRVDSLVTSVSGSYYDFSRGTLPSLPSEVATTAWVGQAVETWQHQVGRQGRLRLGLGLGFTGNAAGFPRLVLRDTSVVAEAVYLQAFGRPEGREEDRRASRTGGGLPGWTPAVVLAVGARMTPFVDFTSGLAYNRVDAFADLGCPLDLDWRLDASASAGVAIDGVQHGQATEAAHLAATWRAASWLQLSTGLSGVWQRAGAGLPASTIRQLSAFFRVTVLQGGEL